MLLLRKNIMELFPKPGAAKGRMSPSEEAYIRKYHERRDRVRGGWSRETSSQRDTGGSDAAKRGFPEEYLGEDRVTKIEKSVPIEDLGVAGIDGKPLEEGVDPYADIDEELDNPRNDSDDNMEDVSDEAVSLEDAIDGYEDVVDKMESDLENHPTAQHGVDRQTMISHAEGVNNEAFNELDKGRNPVARTPKYKTDYAKMRKRNIESV